MSLLDKGWPIFSGHEVVMTGTILYTGRHWAPEAVSGGRIVFSALKCQELQLAIPQAGLRLLLHDPSSNSKLLLSLHQELISWVWLGSNSGSDSGKAARVELVLALARARAWLAFSFLF